MKSFILITPDQPGFYYSLFYLLASGAGFALLMWEGHRRRFPAVSWMLVIATVFLFFMLGCRMILFTAAEWRYVLNFQPVPYSPGLSVLGGILFCIPGLLLARTFLGFDSRMIDAFAFVLPVVMVIERFGCLLAGCCYGTPVDLPWAIQYGIHSHALALQVSDGFLTSDAVLSLPVHPVQMYEVLCCLLIVLVLSKVRKHLKAPGNFFMASVALYGMARFLLEFVRAVGGHSMGPNFLGMDVLQWIILVIVLMLVLQIWRRERHKKEVTAEIIQPGFFRPAIYCVALTILFLLATRWISPLEIVALNIVLFPILGLLCWYLFTWTTIPRFRIASLALPMVSLLLMNQTVPEYSKSDSTRLSYNTISIGIMGGNNDLSYTHTSQDCNGSLYTTNSKYSHQYSASALGIGRTVQLERNKSYSFGVDGFTGSHHASGSSNASGVVVPVDMNLSYYGVRPHIEFDWKYFGFGAGILFGEFGTINPADQSIPISKLELFPSVRFRGGSLSKVFGEVRIGNQFPSSYPATYFQAALGFGSFRRDGTTFRIGTAANSSLFLSSTIPAGKHIVIEPFVGIGPGMFSYALFSNDYSGSGLIGSIGLHYKFDRKESKY